MKPVNFEEANQLWKGDGKEVADLPAYVGYGQTISCWELSPEEIELVKETGQIWLSSYNGFDPLQPQSIQVDSPFEIEY